MSFANFLSQRCTIIRPTPSGTDRYNAAAYVNTTVATDVLCRLVRRSIKVLDPISTAETWKSVTLLLAPTGTNVDVNDKVTVDGQTYLVKEFYNRKRGNAQHHVSCIVEILNG
jgi:hypothetical protein